jgi:adenylylsulfate kinase-like enzyme
MFNSEKIKHLQHELDYERESRRDLTRRIFELEEQLKKLGVICGFEPHTQRAETLWKPILK